MLTGCVFASVCSRRGENKDILQSRMKLQSHRFTEANDEDYISCGEATSSMEQPMTPSSSIRAAAFVFILLSTMPAMAQRVLHAPFGHVGPASGVTTSASSGPSNHAPVHRTPGVDRRRPNSTGLYVTPPAPSDEMQSVDDVAAPQNEPREIVIPAVVPPQYQACHRSYVIDFVRARRTSSMPRVVYGSPMLCAHVQIVETGRLH